MFATEAPFPQYFDIDGDPLDEGFLYLGTANQNPETAPITVYWDAAGTQPAAQPIRTQNGYAARNGTPALLYASTDYSLSIRNRKGVLVGYAANSALFSNASAIAAIIANLAASGGSSLVGFLQAGAGAVLRTVQAKLRDMVSITDFGVVGDGIVDDTAAINAALVASKHVIVPAGLTPLISATIVVPAGTRLEFLGAFGNTLNQYPASYFIKKATQTTVGITVAERGWVSGGGLICQNGNTGDGIQLLNNSAKVSHFLVHGAGGNGVRVGQDAGANTNSFELQHVVSQYNGSNGFFIHDGKLNVGADANAGTLTQCFAQHNGASGFLLQHCFWVTVLNCLSEVNTGYGIYLSGANDGTGIPQCRYATVIGGDFNEGNTAGQLFDQSYFSTFINPDGNNVPTTTGSGLAGSGLRNVISSQNATKLTGLVVSTAAAVYPAVVDDGTAANMTYPSVIKKKTGGGNGQGAGLAFSIDDGSAGYVQAGSVRAFQSTTGQWSVAIAGYKAGAAFDMLDVNVNALAVRPTSDNAYSSGSSGQRWSVVYAATGTINTSDRETKQDIAALTDAEAAVARDLKGLIRTFRFKDAVTTKGDAARLHVGAIAQEVRDAFIAHGLDPTRYALFCSDTWHELDGKEALPDENGLPEGAIEVTRLGLRYEEMLAFIIAAL
jgi:endosialidase-like protein